MHSRHRCNRGGHNNSSVAKARGPSCRRGCRTDDKDHQFTDHAAAIDRAAFGTIGTIDRAAVGAFGPIDREAFGTICAFGAIDRAAFGAFGTIDREAA